MLCLMQDSKLMRSVHWGKSHDLLTGTIQISIQRALKDLKKSHYIVKGHGVSGKF